MNRAFLVHQSSLYFSEQPSPFFNGFSPLTALVEGLWHLYPTRALTLLRERIYTDYPLTPACEGMLKVAAKRATFLSIGEFERQAQIENFKKVQVAPPALEPDLDSYISLGAPFSDEEAIQLTLKLKAKSLSDSQANENLGTAVGALLLNDRRELISYAWNTNSVYRTEHAELKLIRSYCVHPHRGIGENYQLFVSLKPCAMCAAQILMNTKNISSLNILYLEDDPGPFSKNSALEVDSDLWLKAGKPALSIKLYS